MSDYILSCCTTADLAPEQYEELNLSYVPYKYALDGEWRTENVRDFDPMEFYSAIASGAMAETEHPSIREFSDYFMDYFRSGKPVLHVTLSSGISDTYYVAAGAAKVITSVYPEAKIYVVDSMCASGGFGLLMTKAAELRDQGYTIEELRDWIEENKMKVNHLFFSTDISYFEKSGRVTKRAGSIARTLSICPLMDVDARGRLEARKNVRTREKVYKEAIRRMEKDADGRTDYDGPVYISTSAEWEDANKMRELIAGKFPKAEDKIRINSIGTTIGSHTGPGTTAIFFWGRDRRDETGIKGYAIDCFRGRFNK